MWKQATSVFSSTESTRPVQDRYKASVRPVPTRTETGNLGIAATTVFGNQELMLKILPYLKHKEIMRLSSKDLKPLSGFIQSTYESILTSPRHDGCSDDIFNYFSPFRLFSSPNMQFKISLLNLLSEGYHIALFRMINPVYLEKTPCFNVPEMPMDSEGDGKSKYETQAFWRNQDVRSTGYIDYLEKDIFPGNHRVIRGIDYKKRPFISVRGSEADRLYHPLYPNRCGECVGTFFQRYTNEANAWSYAGDHDLFVSATGRVPLDLVMNNQPFDHESDFREAMACISESLPTEQAEYNAPAI